MENSGFQNQISEHKESEYSYKQQLNKVNSLMNTVAIDLEEERKWREGSGEEDAHIVVKRIIEKIKV